MESMKEKLKGMVDIVVSYLVSDEDSRNLIFINRTLKPGNELF